MSAALEGGKPLLRCPALDAAGLERGPGSSVFFLQARLIHTPLSPPTEVQAAAPCFNLETFTPLIAYMRCHNSQST